MGGGIQNFVINFFKFGFYALAVGHRCLFERQDAVHNHISTSTI